MLNGHGDDIYSHQTKIVSNFSSNIYNKSDLSGLREHLVLQLSSIHSYPEPDGASLKEVIAQIENINNDEIWLTNGATEAIYLIAQKFREQKASILIPTFSEYEDACLINKIKLSFASSLDNIADDASLYWICNPNNPTGEIRDKQQLISIIESHPNITFVIDQSYQYFTVKETLSLKEAIDFPNVILIQSMTKRFAIPGLRLGYIIANKQLIEAIRHYSMPWSVNQLAIEAGKYLLNNTEISFDIDTYLRETKRFQQELSTISDISIHPTDTHFFLCELKNKKASDLKNYLIENHGILIRDAANFRGLNERYFRLATQSPAENDNFINAIKEWI